MTHLRQLYEPFVSALADWLLMPLPPWLPPPGARDVWKVTAWGPAAPSTEDDEGDGAEPGAPRLFSTTAPDAPRAEHP